MMFGRFCTRFGGRDERILIMKNVSVRYNHENKKMFITRHRNDPRKVLEKIESTNNVLNEMIKMIADYEKDGSLLTFKANNKEFAIVVLPVNMLGEIQTYFDNKNSAMKAEMEALKVNLIQEEQKEEIVPES